MSDMAIPSPSPLASESLSIVINMRNAEPIYVHDNFSMTPNCPVTGLTKIVDGPKTYWVNPDYIIWIGPRS